MILNLTAVKGRFLSNPAWRDFDEISESFDLALSQEVIGWFHQQNGDIQARKKTVNRCELDEHELSLM